MARNAFSIKTVPGNTPSCLSRCSGGWLALVHDEDGVEVYREQFVTEREAFHAVVECVNRMREFRQQQLGVPSVIDLRRQYRKAKQEADRIRDEFRTAIEKMRSPEYAEKRKAIGS